MEQKIIFTFEVDVPSMGYVISGNVDIHTAVELLTKLAYKEIERITRENIIKEAENMAKVQEIVAAKEAEEAEKVKNKPKKKVKKVLTKQ